MHAARTRWPFGRVLSLMQLDRSMGLLKKTFSQFSKDACTTLAAAIAYYTIFALPPLLYLLLMIVSLGMSVVYEHDTAEQRAKEVVQGQAAQMLGNEAASEEIGRIISHTQQQGGSWWKWLISLGGIFVGATGVVAALQESLNRVWEVQPDPERGSIRTVITKRLLSLAMILGLGFLLLVSMILTTVLTAIGDSLEGMLGMQGVTASVINYAVTFAVTVVIFGAIFKFMPDAKIAWRDVWIGALATAVLFAVGRAVMQWYLSASNPGEQLGAAAASLAVILVWVYYTSIIVLLGAEFTQVWASRAGRAVEPEDDAVRVVRHLEKTPAAT